MTEITEYMIYFLFHHTPISFNRFAQHSFYFDNEYIVGDYVHMTFETLAHTHSDLNGNIDIFYFQLKVLEAIDNLKDISYKRPDVDLVFDFITRTTAANP